LAVLIAPGSPAGGFFLRPHHYFQNPIAYSVSPNELRITSDWREKPLSLEFKYHGGDDLRLAWGVVAILMILWLLGFTLHIAGGLIHLLLVIALVVFLIDLISNRSAA